MKEIRLSAYRVLRIIRITRYIVEHGISGMPVAAHNFSIGSNELKV
jgi:hypothetical protein